MDNKKAKKGVRWTIALVLALVIAAVAGVQLFGNVLRATGPAEEQTTEATLEEQATPEEPAEPEQVDVEIAATTPEPAPAAPEQPASEPAPSESAHEQGTTTPEAATPSSEPAPATPAEQQEEELATDTAASAHAAASNTRQLKVSLDKKSAELELGETLQLKASRNINAAALTWTSSDPSVATVSSSGIVTAKKAGTATITVTASYSNQKATASATITVSSDSYPVFCYALIPGAKADDSSNPDNRWLSIGVATVSDVPDPTTINGRSVASYTVDLGATQFNTPMYPDIRLNGVTYRYSPNGGENTYSLIPMRLVSAHGINAGNNAYFTRANIPSRYWTTYGVYHLDFTCVLNETAYHNVTFQVKEPTDETFIPVESLAVRVKDGTAESSLKPSSSAMPATKKSAVSVNGRSIQLTYEFDGWYVDEACTTKATFSGKVTENAVYYGRYVPTNSVYTIHYFYDGVEDASKTTVSSVVALGTEVDVAKLTTAIRNGRKSGYAYANATTSTDSTGATLVVRADPNSNTINLYYENQTRTYKVNYYLNGTDTPVSSSELLIGELGDVVVAEPRQIAGYTPVSADGQSITIKDSGNEITFYYRRNVQLVANADEPVVYDGESHRLSFSVVGELEGKPAQFEDIELKAHKNAGTHEDAFADGTVGTVDATDTYVVTAATGGTLVIEPAPLSITTPSATKPYDGEPLAATEGAEVQGLVAGETLGIELTGSQTEVGSSENTYELTWKADGNDYTAKQGNYVVASSTLGQLVVTESAEEVVVVTTGGSFTYDGQPHGATVEVQGLPAGYTVEEAACSATATNVADGAVEAHADTLVIKNRSGRDVTDSLNITFVDGTIQVVPRPVTITVTGRTSATPFVYDGTEHVVSGYDLACEDTLFSLGSVAFTGSAEARGTGAGTYAMGLVPEAFACTDENFDATFAVTDGQLVVNKATNASLAGVVSMPSWTYGDAGEHVASASVSGANDYAAPTIEYRAADAEEFSAELPQDAGAYVVRATWAATDNCEGLVATSTFTIGKAQATVVIPSAERTYDGTPLSVEGTIELVGEDTATVSTTVSVTDATEQPVANGYEIDWGNTNPNNYEVSAQVGTLHVSRAPITVTTPSATGAYDGKPLTASKGAKVQGLVEGEEVTLRTTGSQTEVGSSENTYELVWDGSAQESNYVVAGTELGTLTVTQSDEEIVVTTTGGTFEYDGQPHGATVTVSELPEGYELVEATSSATATNVADGAVEATADTLVIHNANGKDVTDELNVTFVDGTVEVVPRELVVATGSAERPYDATPLTAEGTLSGLVAGEEASFSVTGSVTDVDTVTNTYELVWDGSAQESNYRVVEELGTLTVRPAEVTVRVVDASKEYGTADPTLEAVVEGVVDDFEIAYEVSRSAGEDPASYVASATGETAQGNYVVTFVPGTFTITTNSSAHITLAAPSAERTYDGTPLAAEQGVEATGLPAGYAAEATAAGTITDAGTAANRVASYAVLDANGADVTENYNNIACEDGTLTVTPREVTLTSASDSKVYDGNPLTNDSVDVGGQGFAEGEGATFQVTGSQTIAGRSRNTFGYELNEGTKAGNYDIATTEGDLVVTSRSGDSRYQVALVPVGGTFTYDGQEHAVEGFESLEFELAGNTFTVEGVEAGATRTDAGTTTIATQGTPQVLDAEGNDVTEQFFVDTAPVDTLVVEPRSITIASESATREYDGTPLASDAITVSEPGFVEGEGATYTFPNSQALVGSTTNNFSYQLNEGTKAANYNITTQYGTLTVVDRDARYQLDVTAQSAEFMYDGTAHEVNGLESVLFEQNGVTYAIEGLSAHGEGTDAGEYAVSISGTPRVTDAEGNDVTSQFAVIPHDGTLRIDQRHVTLVSADASKPYDGQPLVEPTVRVSEDSDGFVAGEGFVADVTGAQLLPGFSANSFTYELTAETNPANYAITCVPGTLSVTNREAGEEYQITLQPTSASFAYDGEEHATEGFETLEFEVEGNTYTVEGIEARVAATEAGTYAVQLSGEPRVLDAAGNDVTEQFGITVASGTLEIRSTYLLTISYVDTEGNEVAAPFVGRYEEGQQFGPIPSPEVEGLVPSVRSVQSDHAGMPAQDVALQVTYDAPVVPSEPSWDEPESEGQAVPEESESPETPAAPGGTDGSGGPGNGSGGGTPTVTPAAAAALAEQSASAPAGMLTVSEDGNVSITTIEDERVALGDYRAGGWAILNLICAIATAAISALLVSVIRRKANEDEAEREGVALTAEQQDEIRDEHRARRNWIVGSVVLAVIAVVVFILTEDLSTVPRAVDDWTLVMVVILAAQLGVAFASHAHWKRENDRLQEAIDQA